MECNYCGMKISRTQSICECGSCSNPHPSRDWEQELEYLLR